MDAPPVISTDQILDFIRSRYLPAKDMADSELHLTTDEILIELESHFGSSALSITKEQLIHGLQMHDYRYDIRPGTMQFVWVFREKI